MKDHTDIFGECEPYLASFLAKHVNSTSEIRGKTQVIYVDKNRVFKLSCYANLIIIIKHMLIVQPMACVQRWLTCTFLKSETKVP